MRRLGLLLLPVIVAGVVAAALTLAARDGDPAFDLEQRRAIAR